MKIERNINKSNAVEIQIVDYLNNFNPSGMKFFEDHNDIVISKILDSLEMIKFIEYIEEKFHIHIDEGDVLLENFQYVSSVVEFVKKKL